MYMCASENVGVVALKGQKRASDLPELGKEWEPETRDQWGLESAGMGRNSPF